MLVRIYPTHRKMIQFPLKQDIGVLLVFEFVRIYKAAIVHQDAYVPVNSMGKTNESLEVRLFWLLIYDATSAFVLLLLEYCDWE